MFTVQYIDPTTRMSKMRPLNVTSRAQLTGYLAKFEYEILAVYEQATVITKYAQKGLLNAAQHDMKLSGPAMIFMAKGMRLTTPA